MDYFLGFFLDITGTYKSIMLTSISFLVISFIAFSLTIILSKKQNINQVDQTENSTS